MCNVIQRLSIFSPYNSQVCVCFLTNQKGSIYLKLNRNLNHKRSFIKLLFCTCCIIKYFEIVSFFLVYNLAKHID